MNEEALIIENSEGKRLKAYHFDGSKKLALVIAPATACPQKLYFKFAKHLSEQGLSCYTFDYRGVGESKDQALKQEKSDMYDWGEKDLNAVLQIAFERHERVYLLCHSIGGQIFCFSSRAERLAGVYCMASQSAYRRHWKGWWRLQVELFWKILLPLSTAIKGYMPGLIMGSPDDLSEPAALSWRQFALNPEGSLGCNPQAKERAQNLRIPMVFRALAKDQLLAPLAAVKALYASFPKAPKELRYQENGPWQAVGHFDFFRSRSAPLWQEIPEFIQACEEKFQN